MSNLIEKNQVKKLTVGYRILACFISICCLLAILGIIVFGLDEELTIARIAMCLMPVVLLYMSIPIVFTGYPPKFLFWTMGRKE